VRQTLPEIWSLLHVALGALRYKCGIVGRSVVVGPPPLDLNRRREIIQHGGDIAQQCAVEL
jgi:hypothetical protein